MRMSNNRTIQVIYHTQTEMMKLNIGVSVVAVLVVGFCENVTSQDSNKEDMEDVIQFCKIQEKATYADMEMWEQETETQTRTVKCLEACAGEKRGLITNNRLNVDAFLRIYAAESNDKDELAAMKEILNECKGETDKDRCEASAKIMNCINMQTFF